MIEFNNFQLNTHNLIKKDLSNKINEDKSLKGCSLPETFSSKDKQQIAHITADKVLALQNGTVNSWKKVEAKVCEMQNKWFPFENTSLSEQEKQEIIKMDRDLIFKQVSQGAEGNIELILERLEKLDRHKGYLFTYVLSDKCKNSGFLIDNIETINEKILTMDNILDMGPDRFVLLANLNEQTLPYLSKIASEPDFIEKLNAFIYDLSPHNIKLGEKIVEVDSSDIVAIVSGIQSLSYYRDGNSNSFEATTKSLVELPELKYTQQYYYQIAEGILAQYPELVEIVDSLKTYINYQYKHYPDKSMLDIQQDFFNNLEQKGILPKTIKLRTVVPDENALIEPQKTFELFKQGLTQSQRNV